MINWVIWADWKVGNYIIEYFGIMNRYGGKIVEVYEHKMNKKKLYYKTTECDCIYLYPKDLKDLDNKLWVLTNGTERTEVNE